VIYTDNKVTFFWINYHKLFKIFLNTKVWRRGMGKRRRRDKLENKIIMIKKYTKLKLKENEN